MFSASLRAIVDVQWIVLSVVALPIAQVLPRCAAIDTTGLATGAEGTKGRDEGAEAILCEIRSIRKDAKRP